MTYSSTRRRRPIWYLITAVILAMTAAGAAAAPSTATPVAPEVASLEPGSLSGTRPNIVAVITDDQTISSLRFMPYVQSQLKAGAYLNFTNAEVNNALCCPSRASILTGMVDTRTGVTRNNQARYLDPAKTVAVALKNAGYRTGMFGKLLNGWRGAQWPGWDDFQPVLPTNIYRQYGYTISNNGVNEPHGSAASDYLTHVLTAKAISFIDRTPASQPLFLYVAPTATHTPFVAAPDDKGTYGSTPITLPPNFSEADVSDKPQYIRQRAAVKSGGSISSRRKQADAALGVDDLLRGLEEKLAATGRLDNTVVMFLSDNGLSQGSHRWTTKRCQYTECMAVPMLFRYPGQSGRNDNRLVSNIDVAATFAELAGTTMPAAQDGFSLVPLLEDPTGTLKIRNGILQHWPGGDEAGAYGNTNSVPGYYSLRTRRYRYVELTNLSVTGKTEYELYDLANDPYELVNLADTSDYANIKSQLQVQMYDLIRQTGSTPGAPQGSWNG